MVKIYTSPSCSSCRKVKKWFNDQKIPYIEKNIFVSTLNEEELKDILKKSENGTEDIISSRSKIVKESGVDLESMTIKELIAFICLQKMHFIFINVRLMLMVNDLIMKK